MKYQIKNTWFDRETTTPLRGVSWSFSRPPEGVTAHLDGLIFHRWELSGIAEEGGTLEKDDEVGLSDAPKTIVRWFRRKGKPQKVDPLNPRIEPEWSD